MTAPAIYTRSDLMTLLGYKDRDCFRARLRAMMAGDFFPSPLMTRPDRWSRHQVDAWLAGIRPRMAGPEALEAALAPAPPKPEQPAQTSRLQGALMARRFQLLQGGLAINTN
jgi:hypothetical protein